MKVLVTGANGFVGQAIVSELFANSHEIISNGRQNSVNLNPKFVKAENYFQADISNDESVSIIKKCKEAEAIIHCAGLAHQFGKVSKDNFWKINVAGTKNIANLAGALKVKHFILISSVSVYGNTEFRESVDEDRACEPEDFYAQSKFESERIAKEICEEKGIALTILRPVTVIGEGDRGNFLRLIQTIDKNRFRWIGRGDNCKSLIHKSDVAGACLKVLTKKSDQTEVFNVSAEPLTMKEIVDEIASELKKTIPNFKFPSDFLKIVFSVNSKTIKNNKVTKLSHTIKKWLAEDVYSSEKLKTVYGFESRITVKEAIKREVRWYLSGKNV